ncbi:small ribosomal subunit protein uS7m [Phymastichus coffea]|uniref:small ribosomal subunit protein uS7m n=1 Tax=Phymastichus coffea TaxID=108790 RepID=UPI00273AB484|nr:small ribosomal subunit protein uS7m [Phymastichus coffea]
MASMRILVIKYTHLFIVKPSCSCRFKNTSHARNYSVFPPTYVKSIYDKNTQQELEASGELKEYSHLPIKPAFTNQTSSEFHDPLVNKLINYLTKEGNKDRARMLVERTFENIKRIQIEKYHKASTSEAKEQIELNPRIILQKAIENSTPVLELMKIKKGGQSYQVPVPLTDKRANFLAINWLIAAGNEKEDTARFYDRFAYELIDASKNQGRVIRKKQELYRQCEANRSYAHFRWT